MPELKDQRIYGVGYGWLAMVDKNLDLFLFNPLTRTPIKLPPLPRSTIVWFRERYGENDIFDRYRFVLQVALSCDPPSPDCLISVIYGSSQRPAVYRLGDERWTVVMNGMCEHYNEIISYLGKLYAVKGSICIHVFEYFEQGDFRMVKEVKQPFMNTEWPSYVKCLVESSGDLFHVRSVSKPDKTLGFEVYRFEPTSEAEEPWSRVYNLGGQSMFLGQNSLSYTPVIVFPGFKPNSIYFTDERGLLGCDYHNGVYSLEDNRVTDAFNIPGLVMYSECVWYEPIITSEEVNKLLEKLRVPSCESSNQTRATPSKSENRGKSLLIESVPSTSSKPVHTSKTASCVILGDMNAKYKDQKLVIFKCQGGEMVPVPVQLAVQSSYVRHQLESDIEDSVVSCPYLSEHVLKMLMEYWSVHVGEEFFEEDKVKEIDDWEEEFFIRIGPDNMFDLFVGANYLDVWGCLERGTEFCAEFIRHRKVLEIREYFNLKNDFTAEEENQLKKDWPWSFEED